MRNGVCYDVNAAAAVPPRDEERDRAAHRGIRWSGLVLAIGIVLEVVSTVWTFQKALSAGSFLDGVDCSLYASLVMQETCDRLSDTNPFPYSHECIASENPLWDVYRDIYGYDEFGSSFQCLGGADPPTERNSDLARCVCDAKFSLCLYPVGGRLFLSCRLALALRWP